MFAMNLRNYEGSMALHCAVRLVSILLKDNLFSYQNIGRNLKFDHGKALKNGDKFSHVLEPKCDFWDICDIWIHLLGKLWLLVFVSS